MERKIIRESFNIFYSLIVAIMLEIRVRIDKMH